MAMHRNNIDALYNFAIFVTRKCNETSFVFTVSKLSISTAGIVFPSIRNNIDRPKLFSQHMRKQFNIEIDYKCRLVEFDGAIETVNIII